MSIRLRDVNMETRRESQVLHNYLQGALMIAEHRSDKDLEIIISTMYKNNAEFESEFARLIQVHKKIVKDRQELLDVIQHGNRD